MQPDLILKGIADNPLLMEALKKALEAEFTIDDIQTTMTDESMGQVLRARLEGLRRINLAFKKLEQYKSQNEVVVDKNPAR